MGPPKSQETNPREGRERQTWVENQGVLFPIARGGEESVPDGRGKLVTRETRVAHGVLEDGRSVPGASVAPSGV